MTNMIREFESPIVIKGNFTLEYIQSLFKDRKCYYYYENDIMNDYYRTLVSIAIWKEGIALYPLKNTNMEGVGKIREIIEKGQVIPVPED